MNQANSASTLAPGHRRVSLANGQTMPWIGLGVFRSPPGQTTYDTVRKAIEIGYRHIDTASIYQNESDVGRAIRDCGLPRHEIFLTSKLWNSEQGASSARRGFEHSLERLGLDYVDLYLLHWPVPRLRRESWQTLIEIYQSGRAKAIGVSNFMQHHLEDLQDFPVQPLVNQIEFSPFLYQKELLEYCRDRHIQVQAYSPLTKGQRLQHPTILQLAQKYKKSSAQILLRWSLDREVVVLPKSNNPQRLMENLDLFSFQFTPEDTQILSRLNENLRTGWDPSHELS
jgi:diketogulonate reductase-like aldo/keto reductase